MVRDIDLGERWEPLTQFQERPVGPVDNAKSSAITNSLAKIVSSASILSFAHTNQIALLLVNAIP